MRHYGSDKPQFERLLRRDHIRKEVQLLRLERSHQPLQQPGTAEIAAEADLRERHREPSLLARNPKVSRQRDAHSSACCHAIHSADRRLRHLRQQSRDFLLLAKRFYATQYRRASALAILSPA